MRALLSTSDHAIVLTPCYQSLLSLTKSLCPVTQICLQATSNWECDVSILESAIKSNTKAIIMNWPHNPTGSVPCISVWEPIITLARKHGLWVFSDEVYRGLETDPSLRLPTVASVYEKGLSLGVVSKSLGLAGLRVGWIAGQDQEMLNSIADMKHYLSICNSAPSEVLALIALRNNEIILDRILSIVRQNLKLFDEFLERWSSTFRWIRPIGGCCGFVEVTSAAISVDKLAEQLVSDHGVLIIPGSTFNPTGTDDCECNNFFRIGFGRANFPECLNAFEIALRTIFRLP